VGNTDEMAQNALKILKDEVILQNLKKMHWQLQNNLTSKTYYHFMRLCIKKSYRKYALDFIFFNSRKVRPTILIY
jgi:hypothetical protein